MTMRLLVFVMMLFMLGCGGCENDKPLQKVELKPEEEKLDIKFSRFDDDLFSADFSQPAAASQQLYQKYGQFFCEFVEGDLMLAPCKSDSVGELLKPFVTNRDILETRQEIQRVFTPEKMEELNSELTECLRRWNHFFPDSIVPQIIYYQSAWNNNITCADSTIGISFDCYLGSDNKVTKQLSNDAFPRYKKQNMESKFVVADAMKGWAATEFGALYEKKDLLSDLIFYGKLMYIAEALAPEIEDSTMMSWSSEQQEWAEKHGWSTWKVMANEKVMYQTKSFEISKWFSDGPFTGATGVPQDSPPQLGVWIGWNIVRDYMKAHPELTPAQLWQQTNNQQILAAYRPDKK
jgi:hypothetical protein